MAFTKTRAKAGVDLTLPSKIFQLDLVAAADAPFKDYEEEKL